MIRRFGRLCGRYVMVALRPPLGHRFLTVAVLMTAAAALLLQVLTELARTAFGVAAVIALAYGVLRIVKPDSVEPDP